MQDYAALSTELHSKRVLQQSHRAISLDFSLTLFLSRFITGFTALIFCILSLEDSLLHWCYEPASSRHPKAFSRLTLLLGLARLVLQHTLLRFPRLLTNVAADF
jgi:hypothetical protein